jgi:hypothetical protein
VETSRILGRSLLATTLLLAACSPAAPSTALSLIPTPTQLPSTSPTPLTTAEPSTSAGEPPSYTAEPPASAGAFTICATAVQGSVCPLELGTYTAAVHDRFTLAIADPGWQEERAESGEFATRIVLSRVDDRRQRLTFISGVTGPLSPVVIDPAVLSLPGFKVGQPTAVTIGGTQALSVDVEPAGAQAAAVVAIESKTLRLEPDRRYRVTVAKIPMDQEAAALFMVADAPVDRFATFVTMSDRVLQSVKF